MKNLKKVLSMFLVLLFIITLLPNNLNEVQAAKPKLNSTTLSMSIGDTYTLKLKNNKSEIKWSSSNKKIVSVNSSGKLTAKANGTCNIYAKVGSKKYTCNVTVKSLELNYNSLEMNKGTSQTLQLGNISGDKITWLSFNSDVVSVDKNGIITANKGGNTTVLAFYNGMLYTCKVGVSVGLPVLYSDNYVDVYFYKIVPDEDGGSYNANIYLRIKNKSSQTLKFHNDAIAINGEGATKSGASLMCMPNTTGTMDIWCHLNEEFIDLNNLNISNVSGAIDCYDTDYNTIVEIKYNTNIN